MLQTIFKTLLLSSLMGTVAAALLLLLRPLTRKWFSPAWQYYIWLLALNAFLLPVPKRVTVAYLPQTAPVLYTAPWHTFREVSVATAPSETFDTAAVLTAIWLSGALAVLVFKAIRYFLFKGQLYRHSVVDGQTYDLPQNISVRRTWLVDAPLVIGLLQPTLYLPETLDEAELPYVLAHESVHCKRRDLLFKWYAQAVGVLHWYNPMLWVVTRQIDAECEASCDYAVTCDWNEDRTTAYMRMILDRCSATGMRPLTTKMFGGKAVIKRRFSAIRSGKRKGMRLLSILIALVLCLVLFVFGNVLADGFQTQRVVLFGDDIKIPPAEETLSVPVLPTVTVTEPRQPDPLPVEPIPAPPTPETAPPPIEQARIGYNSDLQQTTEVTVYPDPSGVISFRFESPVANAIAEINIRRADHPAGWGYFLPTDGETLYTFDGFTPNTPYVLTLNAYCAGRYGIEGNLIVY